MQAVEAFCCSTDACTSELAGCLYEADAGIPATVQSYVNEQPARSAPCRRCLPTGGMLSRSKYGAPRPRPPPPAPVVANLSDGAQQSIAETALIGRLRSL